MKNLNKKYAQGDVLIIPVNSIPENVKPFERENGDVILAHGEVTGHAHRIKDKTVGAWVDKDDKVWLDVKDLIAEVTHEEHGTIGLNPGKYMVVTQREYVARRPTRVLD